MAGAHHRSFTTAPEESRDAPHIAIPCSALLLSFAHIHNKKPQIHATEMQSKCVNGMSNAQCIEGRLLYPWYWYQEGTVAAVTKTKTCLNSGMLTAPSLPAPLTLHTSTAVDHTEKRWQSTAVKGTVSFRRSCDFLLSFHIKQITSSGTAGDFRSAAFATTAKRLAWLDRAGDRQQHSHLPASPLQPRCN